MAGLLNELKAENKKSGIFESREVAVCYPMGFPILDQNLGYKFTYKNEDGSEGTATRLGLPAGTHTMFVGPPSSGKTTAALQAGWNIVQPFGEDALLVLCDKEKSMTYKRVKDITGMSDYDIQNNFQLKQEGNTMEGILELVVQIANKKKSDPNRYMYNTKQKDIFGKDIWYYIPTVIVCDSLLSITSEQEALDEISGMTSGGREAGYRGKFYRNTLDYMSECNINIIMINHLKDNIAMGPGAGAKKLTFAPTGKIIPGGEAPQMWSSSIIVFQPVNSKDGIKSEEVEGYNGLPVRALVSKCRTGKGGTVAELELVQEAGFNPVITLMNYAKSNGLIQGRNPKCYFQGAEDVIFDTRTFIKDVATRPEIIQALFRSTGPALNEEINFVKYDNDNDFLRGQESKNNVRDLMRQAFDPTYME